MFNEPVTECHGTRHYAYHCTVVHNSLCFHLFASDPLLPAYHIPPLHNIYLRVILGSKPPKRRDLTCDMRRLDHSRGVI